MVAHLRWHKGGTHTHKALRLARKMMKEKYGARPDAEKVVVLLTDGKARSAKKMKAEAKLLKLMNVKVVVVGKYTFIDIKRYLVKPTMLDKNQCNNSNNYPCT